MKFFFDFQFSLSEPNNRIIADNRIIIAINGIHGNIVSDLKPLKTIVSVLVRKQCFSLNEISRILKKKGSNEHGLCLKIHACHMIIIDCLVIPIPDNKT